MRVAKYSPLASSVAKFGSMLVMSDRLNAALGAGGARMH